MKANKTSSDLKAPSLVKEKTNPQKVTTIPANTNKGTNKGVPVDRDRKQREAPESKILSRESGRWSFKIKNQRSKCSENNSPKEQKVKDEKKREIEQGNNKPTFQRSWSYRRPTSLPNDGKIGETKTKNFESQERSGSQRKMKEFSILKKSSSQSDLNVEPHRNSLSVNTRMTPSVSTSSIPSEVSYENIYK